MMTWTRKAPTESGWYWYRETPESKPRSGFVSSSYPAWVMWIVGTERVTACGGEWSSTPIVRPTNEGENQ